jgi:uncharacterized protein (DUF58 family)
MNTASRWSDRLQAVARYDFSPRFSRRVRAAVVSPLGILLLAAGVAVLVGLALHPRVFALAGGLLAVAAAGVCWPWLTCWGVRAAVAFDRPRGVEGAEVGVSAAVTNHLPWPGWGLTVRDPEAGHAVRLPRVAGRTRGVCRWVFVPPIRGAYPAGRPTLGTGFPFGLWESKRPAVVSAPLLVWPRTVPVGPVPTSDGADVVEGNVTRNKVGSTGDVLGVRPYRRGDSPRRIHWSQSAKHDRLIVCELQSNSRPVVLLVLDADPVVHTPGPDGSREWAVRVTASLAKGWLEAGAQVGLAWGETVLPPQAGGAQLTRLLDELARVGPAARPLATVLADPRVKAATSGVAVVVASDATEAPPANDDRRWVVLACAGFGGPADAAPGRHRRAWLAIPDAAAVPHALRHGTAEASHGS